MKIFSITTVALLIIFQTVTFAAKETFSASGEYLMSDYDTPEIAEQIALNFAKQNASEQAGMYLESHSTADKSELLEDEIKTVASSKVEIIETNISRKTQNDGRILIRADIKATVDTSELDNFIAQAHEQRQKAIERYQNLQNMNTQIKKDIEDFQIKLTNIKSEVNEIELILAQEKINREFEALKKADEFDKIVSNSPALQLSYDVTLLDEAIKLQPKLFWLYLERGIYSSMLVPNVKDMKKTEILVSTGVIESNGYSVEMPSDSVDTMKVATLIATGSSYANSGHFEKIKGNNEEAKKYFDKALNTYNEAVKLDPNYADSYLIRANFYKDFLEDYDAALADYNMAVKVSPQNIDAYIDRAEFYVKLNRFSDAAKDYETAQKLDAENLSDTDYVKIGDVYSNLENYSKALENYNKAIQKEHSPFAYHSRAEFYFNRGELDKALADCNKVTELATSDDDKTWLNLTENLKKRILNVKNISDKKINLNDKDALMQRGKDYANALNFELAIEDFTKVLKLDSKNQDAYFYRGLVYIYEGKYSTAFKDYDKLIKINPNYKDGDAYHNRAVLYENLGENEKALADYDKALEINPDRPQTKNNRKKLLEKMYPGQDFNTVEDLLERAKTFRNDKKYDESIADYTKVLEMDSKNQNAYFYRGLVYIYKENYSEALKDYNLLIELNPNYDTNAYNNRGVAYKNLKEYDKAISDFNKAIEMSANNKLAIKNRGDCYRFLNKYEDAVSDYTKVLELDEKNQDAYFQRGFIYNEMAKYELALEDYNKLIELNPKYSNAYNNRGWSYENLGNLEKALENYNKALELQPNTELYKNNRQRVLNKLNK